MKFKVGDKIKMYRSFLRLGGHVGAVGEIIELRNYWKRYGNDNPTHYVVKFDCYKIPHIYMGCDIDENCDLIS